MNPVETLDALHVTEPMSPARVDIGVKSIREPALVSDGKRILVSRSWPSDVSRAEAALGEWRHDWAPSDSLLEWFVSSEARWLEFCDRYRHELVTSGRIKEVQVLARLAKVEKITLVYTDPGRERNVARALLTFILEP
jgi:uncharacterized protein YeaO (DUF488 family)